MSTSNGSAEAGRIAAACRERRGLHLEGDAMIVELLRDGSSVPEGEEGVTVITCLDRYAMPLIRAIPADAAGPRHASRFLEGEFWMCLRRPTAPRFCPIALEVGIRYEMDIWQYRFVQAPTRKYRSSIVFWISAVRGQGRGTAPAV
ncbi:MAG: hypothetical protein ABIZ80_00400 [Bryobacteraceae bacterium]